MGADIDTGGLTLALLRAVRHLLLTHRADAPDIGDRVRSVITLTKVERSKSAFQFQGPSRRHSGRGASGWLSSILCRTRPGPVTIFIAGVLRGAGMTALGDNVHIFARPHRRAELVRCFETVLGCSVRTVDFPGMAEPMVVVRFPGGGALSIEFVDDAPDNAPDDDRPRLGAWLELRVDDPAAVMRAVMDAGFREVKHPGHPYYFMAPGGQVFTIAPPQGGAAS